MDRSTFATFYAEHEQRLLGYTDPLLQTHYAAPNADDEAQDVCQTVWTSVRKQWATFDTLPSPKYLYEAVRNKAIDLWRHRQMIAWVSLDVPLDEECTGSGTFAQDWLADPCDALDAVETRADVVPLIAAALRMLSPGELRVFMLYDVVGERLPEGEQYGGEKMNLHRARRHLAEAYHLAEQAQREGRDLASLHWQGRGGHRKAVGSTPRQRQARAEEIARMTAAAGLSAHHPAGDVLVRLARAGVDVSVTRVRGGESWVWLGRLAARRSDRDFAGLVPMDDWVKHWRQMCLAAGISVSRIVCHVDGAEGIDVCAEAAGRRTA